ncbi:hypothetical protein ACJX0J_029821, partial [Zea mays]
EIDQFIFYVAYLLKFVMMISWMIITQTSDSDRAPWQGRLLLLYFVFLSERTNNLCLLYWVIHINILYSC